MDRQDVAELLFEELAAALKMKTCDEDAVGAILEACRREGLEVSIALRDVRPGRCEDSDADPARARMRERAEAVGFGLVFGGRRL